jgi:hypothetical protein
MSEIMTSVNVMIPQIHAQFTSHNSLLNKKEAKLLMNFRPGMSCGLVCDTNVSDHVASQPRRPPKSSPSDPQISADKLFKEITLIK